MIGVVVYSNVGVQTLHLAGSRIALELQFQGIQTGLFKYLRECKAPPNFQAANVNAL